jgi:spore photoproduct lyase
MLEELKKIFWDNFSFSPNKNQFRILKRLSFEIARRENKPPAVIIAALKEVVPSGKSSGTKQFGWIRDALIKYRFPQTTRREKISPKRIFLNPIPKPLAGNWPVSAELRPLKIIVESVVKKSSLLANFQKKFPETEVEEIDYYSNYLKKNKFTIPQLKKPLVFIIKERGDFIKPCPCTRQHLSCGYWIFNLGFGCPFDCSYCFLQQYSNFPGVILPANLEDFFTSFDKFSAGLKKPIRIGSGEFCDSLALDEITGYSRLLIPYFKNKNAIFELKTKSNKIANLLKLKPSAKIVISWSLSPASVAANEEKGTASCEERLGAAAAVQKKGFRLGFHFDPIIEQKQWKQLYGGLIDKLYGRLPGPFAWISLGTLRSNRRLKTISESRFPQSNIFYGELLLGADKKLRYPDFIKEEIYREIIEKIRSYDRKTPIYLCMESKQTWSRLHHVRSTKFIGKNNKTSNVVKGLVPFDNIENSLIT